MLVLVDYHVHAVAHGEYGYSYEWIHCFLEKARQSKMKEIGFAEHDEFHSWIDFAVVREVQEKFLDIKIKMGLEIEYIPGREEEIKRIIQLNPYDYIIGSVHFIEGWAFDHPDYKDEFKKRDIDEVYAAYFNLVEKAVASGLFDIVGHIDLIKIWGHRPRKRSTVYYVKKILDIIKDSGMVIEINSSGLRKPVREVYPAQDVIEMMALMNIPITFASDAHHPDQVGENIEDLAILAVNSGYRHIVTLDKRVKIPVLLEF